MNTNKIYFNDYHESNDNYYWIDEPFLITHILNLEKRFFSNINSNSFKIHSLFHISRNKKYSSVNNDVCV